jgi:hypothetical protein
VSRITPVGFTSVALSPGSGDDERRRPEGADSATRQGRAYGRRALGFSWCR